MRILEAIQVAELCLGITGIWNARGGEASAGAAGGLGQAAPKSAWGYSASLGVKEAYDSNVFLQDHGDQAKESSWVTSVLPAAGVAYKPSPAFNASLSYAPDISFYHSAHSEDYVAHRGNLNLSGVSKGTSWEWLNGIVWIDGSELGPRFTGGGDVPAIGGIPLRDRRAAAIYRNSVRVTQRLGDFFLRPVFTSYVHDFHTEQHVATEPGFAGYENYIDRYELAGGLDAGYRIGERTWLVGGYRYGHQEQGRNQFNADSPYSNNFHRFLAGLEGAPAEWLKLSVLAGPDVRDFGVVPGFDRHELLWYIDGSATVKPTERDSVTLQVKRYEQPAFSSHSMYEDIVYDGAYRHKFSEQFSAGGGFKAYGGDWQAPVNREDWIYTVSATVTWAYRKWLGLELGYSYDWVNSEVPNTQGREFTRHLVWLMARWTL